MPRKWDRHPWFYMNFVHLYLHDLSKRAGNSKSSETKTETSVREETIVASRFRVMRGMSTVRLCGRHVSLLLEAQKLPRSCRSVHGKGSQTPVEAASQQSEPFLNQPQALSAAEVTPRGTGASKIDSTETPEVSESTGKLSTRSHSNCWRKCNVKIANDATFLSDQSCARNRTVKLFILRCIIMNKYHLLNSYILCFWAILQYLRPLKYVLT